MCKTYYIPAELCAEIRGIILEFQIDESPIIKAMEQSKRFRKEFTFSNLMKWERIVAKKAAKECNAKIFAETGIYISKNTLAKVLNKLSYGSCYEDEVRYYFIKTYKHSYEYRLDEQLAKQELKEGY